MKKFDFRSLRLSSGGYRYEKVTPCSDEEQNSVYKGEEGFVPVGGKFTVITYEEFKAATVNAKKVAEYSDGSADYKTI